MRAPSQIAAGDTVSWTDGSLCLPDGTEASPSTHTLMTAFRGPAKTANVDITASVEGGLWVSRLSSVQTAAFNTERNPATWYWNAYVTAISDGARRLVGQGQMLVLPNFAALSGECMDARTQSQKDLAAVREAISARAAGRGVESYTIGNRSLKYMAMTDLLELESRLQLRVQREKQTQNLANGLGNSRKSFIRFTR